MTKSKRIDFLPRGLSRTQAAVYVGVSTSLFDQMVTDGRMPPPREINRRRIWDRHQVDASFDELPGGIDDVPDRFRRRRLEWSQQQEVAPKAPSKPHELIDAETLAELQELSKTPGAVVYYRGALMDRETFRQTILSKPMGKREREALRALYDRRDQPPDQGTIKGADGLPRKELEARGYVDVSNECDRFISWRISDAGIAAVEAGLAAERSR